MCLKWSKRRLKCSHWLSGLPESLFAISRLRVLNFGNLVAIAGLLFLGSLASCLKVRFGQESVNSVHVLRVYSESRYVDGPGY
jgi:hypothetical protein